MGLFLVSSYRELVTDGLWVELTSRQSEWYHPLWRPFVIGQNLAACALMLAWVWVVYLFYQKKRLFRRSFVAVAICTLGLSCVHIVVLKIIYPEGPLIDPEDGPGLLEEFVMFGIFIPYIIFSRRVKAVFSH